jgi:formate/nitrite transporter
MVQAGKTKANLPIPDLLVRGMLSGALLGIATTLAIACSIQTVPLVGALVFPIGFIIISILGLELVSGNFALLPLAVMDRRISMGKMLSAFGWVFVGNLLGSLFYAGIFWAGQSMFGQVAGGPVAEKLVLLAQTKTTGFSAHGLAGFGAAFVRAAICNWMVCFGVVMVMTSTTVTGKILAGWLPIFVFFAQGFEHTVVNMFVIPCGMLFGAHVTMADWWCSNQLIVTAGNLAGGLLFTALPMYFTYQKRKEAISSTNRGFVIADHAG